MAKSLSVNQMELSDILAILDILVTVLIGFVITHMVSVRDSRTRAIKDYYIQELSEIKSEINRFYSDIFKNGLSAQEIIAWYTAIRNRIDSFDKAVKKTFKIYEAGIAQKLFYNYKTITNSNVFNANYKRGKIVFDAPTRVEIGKNQKKLYLLIERTLYDINNARARDFLERKWMEIKSHYLFYRNVKKTTKRSAFISIIKDWSLSYKSSIIFIFLIIFLMHLFFLKMERFVQKNNGDNSCTTETIQRLDSLDVGIKELSEKNNNTVVPVEPPSTYYINLNEISSIDTTTLKGWIITRK